MAEYFRKKNCKYDVTALGELLVDMIQAGVSEQGNKTFEANPGGAPCNVLSMLSKLGDRTCFIGNVGDDMFGRDLTDAAAQVGIDTAGIHFDPNCNTTLALVHKLANGDRDFSFYRKPGADMMLTPENTDTELIRQCRIFHFGSLSLTSEPVRSATVKALQTAKESGCLISFDPNLREPLWPDMDLAREQIAYGISVCDFLKISDNEIQWFTGEEDYDRGIQVLQSEYSPRLICLSMGSEGSRAYMGGPEYVEVPAFLQDTTIETTGAGDCFNGCVLHYLLHHDIDALTPEMLEEMLTMANAAASIVTTRKGALRSMPEDAEIKALIRGGR